MYDELIESWQIHNRINLYLLEAIHPEHLHCSPGPKGRTVGHLFAHLHNVRLMWLKAASPELLKDLEKLEPETLTAARLIESLTKSASAIETLIAKSLADGGRVKGFKPHTPAFVCYLIAHEAHHRGQAMLILRINGQPVDKKISFGIWEWGTR